MFGKDYVDLGSAVQDTIFALSGKGYDPSSKTRFAGFPTRYTLDKGLTWHFLTSKSSVSQVEIGRVTTKNNVTYELDYHTGPDRNGKGSSYILAAIPCFDRIKISSASCRYGNTNRMEIN